MYHPLRDMWMHPERNSLLGLSPYWWWRLWQAQQGWRHFGEHEGWGDRHYWGA